MSEEKPTETEVQAKPTRRKFTAAYKLRIVEEAQSCKHGEIASLLRREGLYAAQLNTWRKHKHSGIAMLSPAVVHAGNAGQVLAKWQCALDAAYARHPERFSRPPETLKLAKIVELNPEKGVAEVESVE